MLRATLRALSIAATQLGAQQQTQPQVPRPVQTQVALALVLAVDASGSVSTDRFELQKQGYAAAFRNRHVLNSIRSLATPSIAGDGANNRGRSVTQARDEATRDGISINDLPILALEPDLGRYYYDNVIGGPGAFMVPARNHDTFSDAILRKLITEIAGATPSTQQSSAK